MTDEQIKHMVDKFLAWQLPDDFHPDCGISYAEVQTLSGALKPIGTNLFTATQAEQMIRHIVEGL